MSEMIERVAKVMYEQVCCTPWPPDRFDAVLLSADDWRAMARAGTEAMREPTDAMLGAGRQEPNEANPYAVWRAMIDGALK